VIFSITDTLNTQAIHGLDFLEQHHCIINTKQKVLRLYGKSIRIEQQKELPHKYSGPDVEICTASLDKTLHIPALSEVELFATVRGSDIIESPCIEVMWRAPSSQLNTVNYRISSGFYA